MSYIVIKVYSFECNISGNHSAREPGEIESQRPTLRDAHKEIRAQGWEVHEARGMNPAAHFCPMHKLRREADR